MKRTIKVKEKEKELIERLNNRDNRYDIHMDPAAGDDKTVVTRWDNHGPVQFEEEDTKTTIVKETPEVEPCCNAYYNADNEETLKEWDKEIERPVAIPEGELAINLDPTKNMTDEDKIIFNEYGPCDINEVGGDYKEDKDNLTDAEKCKRYANFMINLKKACGKNIDTRMRPQDLMKEEDYEEVNHPSHYNNYDVEVIDMMERIFGREATIIFCKLNAFKYRMRAGTKPGQSADKDLNKEKWYLAKKEELEKKL